MGMGAEAADNAAADNAADCGMMFVDTRGFMIALLMLMLLLLLLLLMVEMGVTLSSGLLTYCSVPNGVARGIDDVARIMGMTTMAEGVRDGAASDMGNVEGRGGGKGADSEG